VWNHPAGIGILNPLSDSLDDVKVVQYVVKAAVVWQAIEKRTHGFFGSHVRPSADETQYTASSAVARG
jgi:hypothetical protein